MRHHGRRHRGTHSQGAAQTDELLVCVSDERRDAYFEIHPERDLALDVFYHPYAYCGDDQLAA
jgi:hypothetical protein